ncbi:TRAP transporter substrate-binding protein DctP [Vallitalea longa]|uniref:TRAP transporter substrate-binding protein DctP n=1 Tax=Vallitalea longa TaxID=2936439 RepID=UPI00249322B7|nr:TRAP transporter substrate-binding protein DctP [Vallitalea longa]
MKRIKIAIIICFCLIFMYINYARFFNKGNNTLVDNRQLIFRLAESRCSKHPSVKATQKFIDLVKERTNGEIEIIKFDSSDLGNETNIAEQIEFGGIDFARVSTLYLSNYVDEINMFFLPNIFKDRNDIELLLDGEMGSLFTERLKNEKINLLAWYEGSRRGIYTNTSMIYLEGLKIGVPENETKMNEMISLSFSPIPVKVEDIYNYIKSGYIQGAENDLLEYYYNNNYEVAKYFYFMSCSYAPEALIASNTAIKQLTPEQQKIISEAAKDSAVYEKEEIIETETKVIEELKKAGINFVEYDHIEKFNEAFEKLYVPFRDKYVNLLNEITRIGEDDEK